MQIQHRALILGVLLISTLLSCSRSKSSSQDGEWEAPRPAPHEVYSAQPSPQGARSITAQPRYDNDGVVLLAAEKFYGAAVPAPHQALGCSIEGCRIAVYMSGGEIEKFLRRYFPYQRFEHNPITNAYTVYDELIQDSQPNTVVPNLDKNVVQPSKEEAVKVEAAWIEDLGRFEIQYHNPSYKAPGPAPVAPIKEDDIVM